MFGLKKWRIIIVGLFVVFICIIYLIIFFDTNSVIDDFKAVANGESHQIIDYGELARYDGKKYFKDFSRANVEIRRTFVMHNFNEGYMNIVYTIERFNDKGEHIYGAWNIPAKWYIKKIDGRWQVTKIEEAS